jgi:hypothetical protein
VTLFLFSPASILGHGDSQSNEPQPKLVKIFPPLILQQLCRIESRIQVLALTVIKTFTRRAVKDIQV